MQVEYDEDFIVKHVNKIFPLKLMMKFDRLVVIGIYKLFEGQYVNSPLLGTYPYPSL